MAPLILQPKKGKRDSSGEYEAKFCAFVALNSSDIQ
jgi:hypothetical protein